MDQFSFFVLFSPFACVVSAGVALYCWQHRYARGAAPLASAMSAATAYLLINTFELVAPSPQATLFFARLCYPFIGLLTVNWLAFTIAYADRGKLLTTKYYALLWIIPVITTILVFTNDAHRLIWNQYTFAPVANGFLHMRVAAYGLWFWAAWLYSHTMILAGAGLIIWSSIFPKWQFQMQSRWTLAGAIVPLVFNALYVLRIIPGLYKDFSPLSYAFSGIFFAISIFKYRLLDLTPFARATMIDNSDDGMLTLDAEYRVVDFNPAGFKILDKTHPLALGKPYPLLSPYLDLLAKAREEDTLQMEIILDGQESDECYDLRIRRLRDQRQETIGYLVSFHNITEHKKLLQITEQLAVQDSLTGVLNRHYFIAQAKEEIERIRNEDGHFSIVMIDIDFFKKINDTLGHKAGDQVLQAFVSALRLSLRGADLIGRIGGDEFVVLLPNTRLQTARQLADRLCAQFAGRPLQTEDCGSIPITLSMGIAESSWRDLHSLEEIIEQADKHLYLAKELGRNQICVAEGEFQTL